MSKIKTAIHKCFRMVGLDIVRAREETYPPDFGDKEIAIIRNVRPWTLTSPERIYALIQAVRYITASKIDGAIVECGVWKGGSMAAAARTLLESKDEQRDLYLFDTFAGMTEPAARDVDYSGKPASELLSEDVSFRCTDAPLDRVKEVLYATGYPKDRMHFVQGRVEDTLPAFAPDAISLLRLDTDWYESTKHELTHLYPRLARGGIIIIDDYGHWRGSRLACDEYFAQNHIPMFLNRIDYTGRIGLKP